MAGLSSNFKTIEGGVDLNVSAPGKVILHGEHSVVYGKLALAASLGLRTKLHLFEIDSSNKLILKFLPLDFEYAFNLNDIQKQLLDKPTPVTSQISDFNWEFPKLVNHQSLLEIVEKVVKGTLDDKIHPPVPSAIQAVKSVLYLFSGILSSTNVNLSPMCITVDSEISMGAGTGSSASFSVAFAGLIISYLKLKTVDLESVSKPGFKKFRWEQRGIQNDSQYSPRELDCISDWAFCCEKIFHGTPSGLDNTVCTYGNLVKYRKNHSTTHLTLTTPLNLLLVNTNVPRETKKMVSGVAKLKEDFPHLVEHVLDALEDLTVSASDVIKKIDNVSVAGDSKALVKGFEEWKTLIQINHSLLCALGVSHQKLEEINMILGKYGLTGKLTGAGGGGYAISIIPQSYDPEEVIRVLIEHGFGVTFTKLGGSGVRID